MITNDDITKLIAVFKTRQEDDESLYKLEENLNQKFDRVMTQMDRFIGELKTIRQEQVTHVQRHEDLEKEVEEIKNIPAIAHELKK